jgi:hypothetical protein
MSLKLKMALVESIAIATFHDLTKEIILEFFVIF